MALHSFNDVYKLILLDPSQSDFLQDLSYESGRF